MRQRQKMETWKMWKPDSMCTEQRRKWHRIFFHLGEQFMPRLRDFRSRKGAWLGSHQNLAKMSGGLQKTDSERLIHLVSQNHPPWCSLYQIMICILLELFLCDIVHPEGIFSFTPSSKKDEYYCQQLPTHKQSLSKFRVICCLVLQRQSNLPKRR